MNRTPHAERYCHVADCDRAHHSSGYCRKHYRAFAKWGDPLNVGDAAASRRGHYKDDPDDFWSRVNKTDTCWLWTGGVGGHGYGVLTWRGRKGSTAHRVSYILTHGCAPAKGLHIDHVCMVRLCVNPAHLEAVTPKENRRRYLVAKRAGRWSR